VTLTLTFIFSLTYDLVTLITHASLLVVSTFTKYELARSSDLCYGVHFLMNS